MFCCSIMMSGVASATETQTEDKIEDAITSQLQKVDSITAKVTGRPAKKAKKNKKASRVNINITDSTFNMTAVSDTTNAELEDDTTAVCVNHNFSPIDWSDNFDWNNCGENVIVPIVAIICVILVPILAVCAIPIIIIWIIFNNRRRRERERRELLKAVAASGKDTTPIVEMIEKEEQAKKEEMKMFDDKSATFNKGIKNVCLGTGLAIFFWFLTGALGITAIGFLIICIGVGQILTSKYSK